MFVTVEHLSAIIAVLVDERCDAESGSRSPDDLVCSWRVDNLFAPMESTIKSFLPLQSTRTRQSGLLLANDGFNATIAFDKRKLSRGKSVSVIFPTLSTATRRNQGFHDSVKLKRYQNRQT
jgi:hypothetical protein